MAIRFIDTGFYKSPFVRGLEGALKGLYGYIICDCSAAGIWNEDFEIASIYVGFKISKNDFEKNFVAKGKAIFLGGGKYFFPDFIQHQYPKGLQKNNPAHQNIINELLKFKLIDKESLKVLTSPSEGAISNSNSNSNGKGESNSKETREEKKSELQIIEAEEEKGKKRKKKENFEPREITLIVQDENWPTYEKFAWIKENCPKVLTHFKTPLTEKSLNSLVFDYGGEVIKNKLFAIESRSQDYLDKYENVNALIRSWLRDVPKLKDQNQTGTGNDVYTKTLNELRRRDKSRQTLLNQQNETN